MQINFINGGLSMRYSMGVFEASRQLAISLAAQQQEIRVFGIRDPQKKENYSWGNIQPESFNALPPRRLGYSGSYLSALLTAPADLSHLHGIWMYQSAMAYKWHKKFSRPYITTVHGMLEPWAVNRASLKKKLAMLLYEKTALHACACFHAISVKEYEQIRNFNLNNPISIIRNGICIPDLSASYKTPPWENGKKDTRRTLLYFGRVHPKKGLANLIQAMALLKAKHAPGFDEWKLVIAGGQEKGVHEQELAALIARNRLDHEVKLLGQYFHEDKEACYYHSDAFILPSYSEGMPLAALEAWAFGKFTLLTPNCNLPDGFENGVADKIEADPDSIANGLSRLFCQSKNELTLLGNRARSHAASEYSWTEIARKMSDVYKWVAGKAPVPQSVRLL